MIRTTELTLVLPLLNELRKLSYGSKNEIGGEMQVGSKYSHNGFADCHKMRVAALSFSMFLEMFPEPFPVYQNRFDTCLKLFRQ